MSELVKGLLDKGNVSSTYNRPLDGRVKSGDTNGFKDALKKLEQSVPQGQIKTAAQETTKGVKFSNHAVERMMHRGIQFGSADLQKLEAAIEKASLKGARDTLVLMDQAALIVSVKNKTVVTVMDKANLKENVFTNIDSTVVI